MPRPKQIKNPTLDDTRSCRQCEHWHERTTPQDDDEWGECWRDPPEMVVEEGEDGEPVFVPKVRWFYLPYACASLKPRQ